VRASARNKPKRGSRQWPGVRTSAGKSSFCCSTKPNLRLSLYRLLFSCCHLRAVGKQRNREAGRRSETRGHSSRRVGKAHRKTRLSPPAPPGAARRPGPWQCRYLALRAALAGATPAVAEARLAKCQAPWLPGQRPPTLRCEPVTLALQTCTRTAFSRSETALSTWRSIVPSPNRSMATRRLARTGLDDGIVTHLSARNINTAKDLLESCTPLDVSELLDCSETEAAAIIQCVRHQARPSDVMFASVLTRRTCAGVSQKQCAPSHRRASSSSLAK